LGVAVAGVWTGRPGASMPSQGGPPNGSLSEDRGNGRGTIRDYDQNGDAETDYDFGQNHGYDPEAHDWDWTNPNNPRGPGRPLDPCE
jgi:hypothetical protein